MLNPELFADADEMLAGLGVSSEVRSQVAVARNLMVETQGVIVARKAAGEEPTNAERVAFNAAHKQLLELHKQIKDA